MSGGVDSSVAALLLKKAGADVFGVSMQIVPWSRCCLPDDLLEAKYVAKKLGIKHYLVDLKDSFKKTAINYFVKESMHGRNPNPCVPCNRKIKFGALLKFAEKHGAEYFATGHYARLKMHHGEPILLRPVDVTKDQSYVLSMLPRNIFKKLIFPVGDYTKEEVRKIARGSGLRIHQKPSNQDLCFLNKEKGEFIEWWTGKQLKPGNIVDTNGNVLGKHAGLAHYTIGQRRGLGIESHKRYYVAAINLRKNQLIVGEENELFRKSFYVEKPNWVSIKKLSKPMNVEVIIRNKMKPQTARIVPKGKQLLVVPTKPVWAVSPGQIAVFIKGKIVLGGGWIK
jgi:tRNA-specific 2-thiouridylase